MLHKRPTRPPRRDQSLPMLCILETVVDSERVMSSYWIWWIAAAVADRRRVTIGNVLFARCRLALACGGVAAWFGSGEADQWLIAGVLGVSARSLRIETGRRGAMPPLQASLDVGQMVHVQAWGPDGTARVAYRGSTWDAELATPDDAAAPRRCTSSPRVVRCCFCPTGDRVKEYRQVYLECPRPWSLQC